MTNYYLDTSALGRRYLAEIGSGWLNGLIDPTAGHVAVICDLTPIEFFSALTRRQRENTLNAANALILRNRFLADYQREYLSIPLESPVLERARNLVSQYPLRSLDAIQLASAIVATQILNEPMIFLSGDANLLKIAVLEGFVTDNPYLHP